MTGDQPSTPTTLIPQDKPADQTADRAADQTADQAGVITETAVLDPTPDAAPTAAPTPALPPVPTVAPTPTVPPVPTVAPTPVTATIDGPHWGLVLLGLLGLLTAGWFYAAARWDWDLTLRWSTYSTVVSIGLGVALVALGLIGITRSSARRR